MLGHQQQKVSSPSRSSGALNLDKVKSMGIRAETTERVCSIFKQQCFCEHPSLSSSGQDITGLHTKRVSELFQSILVQKSIDLILIFLLNFRFLYSITYWLFIRDSNSKYAKLNFIFQPIHLPAPGVPHLVEWPLPIPPCLIQKLHDHPRLLSLLHLCVQLFTIFYLF